MTHSNFFSQDKKPTLSQKSNWELHLAHQIGNCTVMEPTNFSWAVQFARALQKLVAFEQRKQKESLSKQEGSSRKIRPHTG